MPPLRPLHRWFAPSARRLAAVVVGAWLGALLAAPAALASPAGEAIYRAQCAKCHGPSGEGVADHFPDPLLGDRSVLELASLIEKTMPEDDPDQCRGDDAQQVAEYIHDAFYSPLAQARNKPARIELSRLTVGQHQNALADLIGSFRRGGDVGEERGLRGEYFRTGGRRGRRGGDRVFERLDPQVQFDFGDSSPKPGDIDPVEFSMSWNGAVLAPETGEYEFIVRSENGLRLWVNELATPLIDASVKSGDDTEFRGSLRLLGGRWYPLRLEAFKSRQSNEKTASVSLEWRPPHRAAELIPTRCLSPARPPTTFVVETRFPPDDRSIGYERGSAVSKEWHRAATGAALETAAYVAARLNELAGASGDPRQRDRQVREFCRQFVERALRRPLDDDLRRVYVDRQFEQAPDQEAAVKRVVLLMLTSPRFLYREAAGSGAGFDVAERLSFALWDSLPDGPLVEAAAQGQLSTREQIVAQAERMAADPRARQKLRTFVLVWLGVDHLHDLAKDSERYPDFDAATISDLRTSLDLLIDDVLASPGADFRRLLLADEAPLNGRLAKFYGVDLPADAPFQSVAFEPDRRAGVLTHPYLLAGFAYTAESSPIHRGVFVARNVLGRMLRPPPEAVSPLAPDIHADLTTRERITLQTSAANCRTCHQLINPLGFTLEQFDAVGRFRSEEKGKPIDPTGSYITRTGEEVSLAGPRELAAFLAASDETHAALAEQLFHHLVKQPVRAFGPDTLDALRTSFTDHEYNLRRLSIEIAVLAAAAVYEPVSTGPTGAD